MPFFWGGGINRVEKKYRILEIPNLSTDANRSTNTERNIQGFFLLWVIWLSRGGLLCTLQQSNGLHFYPLNYTALHFFPIEHNKKFQTKPWEKKIRYFDMLCSWTCIVPALRGKQIFVHKSKKASFWGNVKTTSKFYQHTKIYPVWQSFKWIGP